MTRYRWEGRSGTFKLQVSKPFDPNPPRLSQTQHAQLQGEELLAQTPPEVVSQKAPEPLDTPPEPPEATSLSEEASEKPELVRNTSGIFSALANLIGESTLLTTLCKHGDDLSVTLTPFGDDKASTAPSITLTATAAELDEGFVQAVAVKTESRKALAEQIEALEEAEKELVDAKKAETEAKTKDAKEKKVAAGKKQEEEKKKTDVANQAGEQGSIF